MHIITHTQYECPLPVSLLTGVGNFISFPSSAAGLVQLLLISLWDDI